MERFEKAIKAAIPKPSLIYKKGLATFKKLTFTEFNEDEFMDQVAVLVTDIDDQLEWYDEKDESYEAEVFQGIKKEDKDKIKKNVIKHLELLNNKAILEKIRPYCETVMSNAKKLKKKKELPEEFVKEVSTLCWVANKIQIPALGRVALQFNLKYGEKFESKIAKKAKNVDEEVVNMFDYKPHKSEIKKSTEEFKAAWEQRQKEIEEELARLEAEREEARRKLEESSSSSESSSDSDSDSDKPKKKSHKKSKKESSSSESSSESESEDEKPKKKAAKEESSSSESESESEDEKPKKKAAKKEESSSSESSSESEEEKPKKKSHKKSKKESSSSESSSSESEEEKPKKKSHKKSKKESSSSESESEEEKPKKAAKTEEKPAEPAEEKPAETAAPAESA